MPPCCRSRFWGTLRTGPASSPCAFRRRQSWVASSFRPARRCSRRATRSPRRPARGWRRCSGRCRFSRRPTVRRWRRPMVRGAAMRPWPCCCPARDRLLRQGRVRSRSPWRRPWKRARASLLRRRPGPRRRRVPPRKPGPGVSPATAATIRPIACMSARGASRG